MANLISSTVTGTLNVTGNVTAPTFVGNLSGNASTATSANQIDGVSFTNTGSNSAVNADTINSNGISYYSSGVSNFSGNATDGALYSQVYSSSWQHQIAGDYRSGQIALRGKNNGTWQSWRKVWDSGNLDAFVGATVSNDTITFTKANGGTVAVTTSDANTNTWRPIDDTPVDGNTTTSISSNWAFDNVKTSVPVNAVFTDTNTWRPLGTGATDAAAGNHNHTSLTGVTSIGFATQSTDSASISTTISGTSTFFDFNLTDDNNNDWWRWRFTPSGSTVYDAMILKPASNGNANLVVSGDISADNISIPNNSALIINGEIALTQNSITGDTAIGVGGGFVINPITFTMTLGGANVLFGTLSYGSIPAQAGLGVSDSGITTDFAGPNIVNLLNGNVGIGTTNPSERLEVDGNILASGDIIAFSDARVKENVETIPNALEKVTSMRGVTYNKMGEEKSSMGVIAQEIQKIAPEVVHESKDGMLSVAYGNITGVLIEAIKEQQKQIKELKAQLDGLTK